MTKPLCVYTLTLLPQTAFNAGVEVDLLLCRRDCCFFVLSRAIREEMRGWSVISCNFCVDDYAGLTFGPKAVHHEQVCNVEKMVRVSS